MYNYTMTFYCRDCLTIPDDGRLRRKHLLVQVLEKLLQHRLELVDFNLTKNYHTYPEYPTRGGKHKTLVEIRLDLNRSDLKSRETIYNRCLDAMQHDELYLSEYADIESNNPNTPENIFVFDMKTQSKAS